MSSSQGSVSSAQEIPKESNIEQDSAPGTRLRELLLDNTINGEKFEENESGSAVAEPTVAVVNDDDESDDDKLHIVEEEEPIQGHDSATKEVLERETVISGHNPDTTNPCPFDCCKKGLRDILLQMDDHENYVAFKKATDRIQECSYEIMKAGCPELLESIELSKDGLATFDTLAPSIRQQIEKVAAVHSVWGGRENSEFSSPGMERQDKRDFQEMRQDGQDESHHGQEDGHLSVIREKRPRRMLSITRGYLDEPGKSHSKRNEEIHRPWASSLPYNPNRNERGEHGGNNQRNLPSNESLYSEEVMDLSQNHHRKDGFTGKATVQNGNTGAHRKSPSLLEKYDHITALKNGNLIYMCKICYTTLKSEEEIKEHLFCQGVTKSVHCYLCRQDFTQENYRQHLEHHDEHPAALKCKPCGLAFDSFASKSVHQRVVHRTDQREQEKLQVISELPYICQLCGQDFPDNKVASAHTLLHINGYPFPCEFCNNWFRGIETAVTRYVLRQNGGNAFMCGIDPSLYTGLIKQVINKET